MFYNITDLNSYIKYQNMYINLQNRVTLMQYGGSPYVACEYLWAYETDRLDNNNNKIIKTFNLNESNALSSAYNNWQGTTSTF
jgi:hypothetical protein